MQHPIPQLSKLLMTAVLGSALVLSGCQTIKGWTAKRSDGSLDYQRSQKLDPIQLPVEQASAAFLPLYPTPELGASSIDLSNDAGKQYQLPPPVRAVSATQ